MNTEKKLAYLYYLKKFVTKERQEKIKEILELRTRWITIALEDVSQSQNVAAIMRTAEAMGLQDAYSIERETVIDIKTNIARGAIQWMTLQRYQIKNYANPTLACIEDLQKQGYRVVATSPHATQQVSDLSIDKKLAFVFGTEISGLSDEALAACDERISIPQYGFVESFNVAVSAALCLYDTTTRLRASEISWNLSDKEKFDLELEWMEHSVERPELMKSAFLKLYESSK
jgi:tRNA (guanosine-2'-O-)-methyltransferase